MVSSVFLASLGFSISVGRLPEVPPDTDADYAIIVNDGISVDASIYVAVPGDRFSIVLRPDSQAQVFLNLLDTNSGPMFTSSKVVSKADVFTASVSNSEEEVGVLGLNAGIRNATLSRYTPEWLYMEAAQLEDNSDVLPPVIKARVRQLGFIEGGTPSAWTEGTFTR
jgi:hypothetical protein